RVFVPDVLSDDGQLAYVAWSPSGAWLSWTESFGSGGYLERRPHAVAIGSGQVVRSIADWQDAVIAWWSPHDLLVVNGRVDDYWTADGHVRAELAMRAAIIDPKTDIIITSVDYSVDVDVYGLAPYPVAFYSDVAVIRYQDREAWI